MIRSESEYRQAVARLDSERARLEEHVRAWKKRGFSEAQVAKLRQPFESFHDQFAEEVESYERLRRGEFSEFENLRGLGQVLIGLRIARGLSQRQLAERQGVSESLVSRDERHEYHGITVDRAMRVLDALGARLVTRVEVEAAR
jgi:ribosome-binding protein aMBF1 (putative translation factor)